MQHTLIKTGVPNTSTLNSELIACFKKHLRILNDFEDDTLNTYLRGAIDAIATYAGNDIFLANYEVFYPNYVAPTETYGWYCGKHNISNVKIIDSGNIDITANYKIDLEMGIFYPHPQNNTITFDVGFEHVDMMPPRLVNIIERYGAELYEHRESSRIGDLKAIPNWVAYSLASVWVPRV